MTPTAAAPALHHILLFSSLPFPWRLGDLAFNPSSSPHTPSNQLNRLLTSRVLIPIRRHGLNSPCAVVSRILKQLDRLFHVFAHLAIPVPIQRLDVRRPREL